MRKSFPYERLDDMSTRMAEGFNRVDAELRAINTRIDPLQRTMLQKGAANIAALIGLIATQL